MFEEIVLKSMPLIKEAFLPNYREDDLLLFQRANKDLEGNCNVLRYNYILDFKTFLPILRPDFIF